MKKLKLLLFYFVAFKAALLFTSCSLSDDIAAITESLDSLKISVGTPRFNTGVNIVFVDAKTKKLIESKSISVSVNGKDASSVYNNIGGKESPYIRKWGMLDLIIDPHKIDSATLREKPIYFLISATIDGYMPTDKPILISEVGKQRVIVEMINEQAPPEGVSIQKFENVFTTGNDGRVTKSSVINIFAPASSVVNRRAAVRSAEDALFTLEIPEGVVLKGFNNQVLVGQAIISVYNTEFSPDNQSYMEPRKITRDPKANNQYEYDHWYFPFGNRQVYITIVDKDNNWNSVASIENGHLKLTTAIPTTFYNRETRKIIAENDILEKSYPYLDTNYYVVKWDKVAKDTVKKVDGKLYLVEKVDKWEQLYCYWGYDKPVCNDWPYFNLTGNFKTNPNFLVQMYSDDYKVESYDVSGVISNETKRGLGFGYPPAGTVKYLFLNSEQNEDVILEYTPNEIIHNCDRGEFTINVKETLKPGVEFIKLNFDLSVSSKTSQITFKPNLDLYLLSENSTLIANQFQLINGQTSLPVVVGKKYKIWLGFYSWMGDARLMVEKTGSDTYKVTLNAMKFSDDGSSQPAGELIFLPKKTADGSIDVRYNAEIPDDMFSALGL